jgi:hypothetical protein
MRFFLILRLKMERRVIANRLAELDAELDIAQQFNEYDGSHIVEGAAIEQKLIALNKSARANDELLKALEG